MMLKKFTILLFIVLFSLNQSWGQTNPTAQSLPYTQNFSSFIGSVTTYPAGIQGWTISGSLSTSFPTTGPNGDQALAGGTNASTSAGVYDMNGKIGLYSTGSSMRAICLSVNTTGLSTINVQFVAATQRTENSRTNEIALQYRVGTSGSFTNVSSSGYQNSLTPTQTTGTASLNPQTVSVTLPSACDNQAVVQLRWVIRDVSGTGNRPSFSIDDINVSVSSSPSISTSGTLNSFITSAVSTPSSEQSFTVSGTNLTSNITVNAPTGYQVSTTSGSGFGSSVTLTQSGGTVAATSVFVRFNPTALADQVGGNITCTSTGASTQNLAVSGEVTNLSPGAIAFIAFQGVTTDLYRIVALNDIPNNTRIWFTDKAWDGNGGTLAFTSGEGNNVWTNTTGSAITAGTVIQFDAAGNATVGTGGLNSGLGSAGEQLFAYQGTLSSPTFVAGYTSGTVISTGVPAASGTDTWVPASLTNGTNFVALGGITFGSSYVTAATNNRTLSEHRAHVHTFGNLTTGNTSTTTNGGWPTYTFNFLPDEPTTQPSFTAATGVGNNQITLNFSGGNGSSYMVVMRANSAVTATPTDATNYSAVSGSVNFNTATELSAGQRIVYNGATSGTSVTVTNLSAGTTYHYAIYAYNGTGALTNFLTTSPGAGNQATTGSSNSSASDIIIHTSFIEPSNIAYHSNQENTNLTDANSIEVTRFTLRDGGATTDADANSTTLSAITFSVTNHSVLRRLAIYNGTTELAEVAVSSGSVSFSGLSLAAADNTTQDFSLRASFAGTVTDNTQFSFAVSSAAADVAGSTFAAADAGAATTSTTGDRNRIEVTATLMAFVQQPSNVSVNMAISPSPTVSANDALGNRDLDYVTDMTATTTGTFAGGSTNTVTPASGLGTFSNLQFSAAAAARTIAVSSGSLTATGNSNTFDITSQIMPGDMAFVSYQTDNPDGFSIITFVDIPASQTFYITENAWTTSSGPLATNETTITWTTPSSVIPAGTVINFSNSTGSNFNVTPSGNGTAVGSGTPGFSTSGEQLLMFRGSNATTPTAFICGVSTTGWINSGVTTSNTSYLPSDLSLNTNGITFSSHVDNGYYNGPQSGSLSTIKALVNNGANWLRSSLIQTLPTWSFTLNATTTTLTANASVENLSLASGETLVIGANTLTINGAVSGSGTIAGGSTSNLTIGGAAGTVSFTSGSRTLNNLLIGTGANASLTLGSALDIASTGSITFNAAGTKSLTTTGQTLKLNSDASGTAFMGNTNGATITGNVTVERFIPSNGRRWRYLAAPFSNGPTIASSWQQQIHITGNGTGGTNCPTLTAHTNGFDASASNGASMMTFNETVATSPNFTNGFTSVANTNATNLTAGNGYIVFIRGARSQGCGLLDGTNPTPDAVTLSAAGTVHTGNFSYTGLTYNASNGQGWNLVGNPYPSNINWDAVGWTKTNFDNTVYMYVPSTNAYTSWNGTTGTGGVTDGIISSGGAFFVKANAASPALDITEGVKTALTPGLGLFKTNKIKGNILIKLQNEFGLTDESVIAFNNDYTDNYNGNAFDAEKLLNQNGLNIYSILPNQQGKQLVFNGLAPVEQFAGKTIHLGITTPANGNHQINLTLNEIPYYYEVYLVDSFLNTITLLADTNNYNFTVSASNLSKGNNRFSLAVQNKMPISTSIDDKANNTTFFSVFPNPTTNQLTISANNTQTNTTTINITNIYGKQVINTTFNTNNHNIDISHLAAGTYFIEVKNGSTKNIFKTIKQ